jgi:hypothetical protein
MARELKIFMSGARPAPVINTTSLPSGQQGSAYSAVLSGTVFKGSAYWLASGLPSGLSINSSTGAISGAPSVSGSFSVAITLRDSGGGAGYLQAQKTLGLSVASAPAPAHNVVTGNAPNNFLACWLENGIQEIEWVGAEPDQKTTIANIVNSRWDDRGEYSLAAGFYKFTYYEPAYNPALRVRIFKFNSQTNLVQDGYNGDPGEMGPNESGLSIGTAANIGCPFLWASEVSTDGEFLLSMLIEKYIGF